MKKLKVCFVGLGSIANRHIINLVEIAREQYFDVEIHALRHSNNPLTYPDIGMYITKTHYEIESLSDHFFDAVFITNPTSLHYDTIKTFTKYTNSFFIEKPLFDHIAYQLSALDISPDTLCYVAAPLRFTEMYAYTVEYLRKHSPICARLICSSYMPDWQKGRDYKDSYRARQELGGGVDIDLIHEIDYMVSLFGFPNQVSRMTGQFSSLAMDTCDVAAYLFGYENMLVEVHLDYFGVSIRRELELFLNGEILTVDFLNKKAVFASTGEQILFSQGHDLYHTEMQFFLALISGIGKNINPLDHAYKVLHLAKGVMP